MNAADYPDTEEGSRRLYFAGWFVGEVPTKQGWLVSGWFVRYRDGAVRTPGENQINARGATRAEAWHRACEQARLMGMLRGRSTCR